MTQSQPHLNGRACAETGRPRAQSNPYPRGTVASDRFNEGYDQATTEFDYLSLSARTTSPNFYGEAVNIKSLIEALDAFVFASKRLDVIKKLIFYGPNPDKNLIAETPDGFGTMNHAVADLARDLELNVEFDNLGLGDTYHAANIIHGVIGAGTETGELAEMLLQVLKGRAHIDLTNMVEESGDVKWYLAMLTRSAGVSWQRDERLNIAKLAKRYPDKFSNNKAHNRDIDGEREILEQG